MENFNVHIINHSGLDLVNSALFPFFTSSSSLIPGTLANNAEVDVTINYVAPDKDLWAAFASMGFSFSSPSYLRPLVLYVFQDSKCCYDQRSIVSMLDASGFPVAKLLSVTKNLNPSASSLNYTNIVVELLPVVGVATLED